MSSAEIGTSGEGTGTSPELLESLPEELIRRIFKPDFASNYLNLLLVSKKWRDFFQSASTLWVDLALHFCLSNRLEEHQNVALWLQKRLPATERLRIVLRRDKRRYDVWKAALWKGLAAAFQSSNLRVLEFQDDVNSMSPGCLELIGQNLPSLESLTVRHVWIGLKPKDLTGFEALTNLTGLRELYMDAKLSGPLQLPAALLALTELRKLAFRIFGETVVILPPEISCLANLQALELFSFRARGDIFTSLTNLTSLKYYAAMGMKREKPPAMLWLPPSLRQLSLRRKKAPMEVAACTALTRLELKNFKPVHLDQALDVVLRRLPMLEKLFLGCRFNAIPPAMTSLKRLQLLDLYESRFQEGLNFFPIGSWLAHLRGLALGRLSQFPMSLAGAVNLEVLDASLINEIDVRAAELLISLPKLRELHLLLYRYGRSLLPKDVQAVLSRADSRLKIYPEPIAYSGSTGQRDFSRMRLQAAAWQ